MSSIEEEYNVKFRHLNISQMMKNSPCIEKFLMMMLIKTDKSIGNKKTRKENVSTNAKCRTKLNKLFSASYLEKDEINSDCYMEAAKKSLLKSTCTFI
jgi:hypothetical protein